MCGLRSTVEQARCHPIVIVNRNVAPGVVSNVAASEKEAAMRWSMLPVSVGAHVIAAVAFVIIPLAAEVEPPDPAPLRTLTVTMKVMPVPSAGPARPSVAPVVPAAAPAPTAAPPFIPAEHPAAPADPAFVPSGVATEGGMPSGIAGGLGTSVPVGPVAVAPPPPPPTPAPTLVRSGQGVREPRKIVDVVPVYPAIARDSKIEGIVILEAVINERGGIERVRVLKSVPLLDAAAVEAVKGWRYTPTLLNGAPVSVLMTITIHFTMHD